MLKSKSASSALALLLSLTSVGSAVAESTLTFGEMPHSAEDDTIDVKLNLPKDEVGGLMARYQRAAAANAAAARTLPKDFVLSGYGLGGRYQNADGFTKKAVQAKVGVAGFVANDQMQPLVFGHVFARYNVVDAEKSQVQKSKITTSLGFDGSVFIGTTSLKEQNKEYGTDLYFGGRVRGNYEYSANSVIEHSGHGWVGLETGVNYQNEHVNATFSPTVVVGGQGCTVDMGQGQVYKFATDAVGYGVVGTAVVNDQLYFNAMYVYSPDLSATKNQLEGQLLGGTFVLDINPKFSLMGNCTIMGYKNNKEVEIEIKDQAGKVISKEKTWDAKNFRSTSFELGFLRKF